MKESGEGILVSHTELPRGPVGNYREVVQPHQLFGSSSLAKFRSCSLRPPHPRSCHYVSRLMIVYICHPVFDARKDQQDC